MSNPVLASQPGLVFGSSKRDGPRRWDDRAIARLSPTGRPSGRLAPLDDVATLLALLFALHAVPGFHGLLGSGGAVLAEDVVVTADHLLVGAFEGVVEGEAAFMFGGGGGGEEDEQDVAIFFFGFNLIGLPTYPSLYDKFLNVVGLVFNVLTIWFAWRWV